MPTCPRCGQDNPEVARFCLGCGAPLAEAAPRKTRKTVTVVFMDVSGSTALGERLDPESLQRVMSRYFEETRAVLEHHGGTIEKFIGDAVMAAFGIPVVHEDDALRAVRAAAEARERLAGLNEELAREWGVEIAARIGINTGEVVAGDPERGQSFATGDAVNVAARLEQAAAPGEILIGEQTHRLVRDAVSVEAVESLTLKGKDAPVAAYRLLTVTPGAPGTTRRLDSPLVGRRNEHKLLQDAFERAVRERACHLFTLLGPAGVGKSRLVEEFLDGLGTKARVLRGRCLPYGEGITYWPLKEALGALGDVEPLLAEEDDADIVLDRTAQVLGLAETTASGEETFWALRRLLEALAKDGPLVVVFDDVHWGEATFLDFVEHVADWSRDARILLVCLARPELLDERPRWSGGKLNATVVLLEPLNDDECGLLVENLLGQAELAREARVRITEAAEGNPLFVEEMLAMLIDDGLLERSNGAWVARGDLMTISVPPTIQAVLAARLDRLAGTERVVIERAAVEGKVFHRGAVAELAPDELRGEVGTHLMALVRKELIRPERADFAGEDAFRFRHLLVRDAAYDAMPKEGRAELHELFAYWLERKAGERVGEYEEILGYHLEQAHRYRGELGPVDERVQGIGRRAAGHLAASGRRALTRADMPAAVNLLSRASALLPSDDPARLELLPDLGTALYESGQLQEAERTLVEATEAAAAAGDRRLEARAWVERTYVDVSIGAEMDEALPRIEASAEVLEQLGDTQGLARALLRRALLLFWVGRLAEARQVTERAIEVADRAGEWAVQAELLRRRVVILFHDATPARELLEEILRVLELARSRGDRLLEASVNRNLGRCHALLGEFEQARELVNRASTTVEEFGLAIVGATSRAEILGLVEMLAGDLKAAERAFRRGYDALEAMGERSYSSTLAAGLAHVLYAQGRDEEALQFSEISEETAATDDVASATAWRSARAKVFARQGRLGEAERLAREAVSLAAGTQYMLFQADTLCDLAEVLRHAGRPVEAATEVQKALELYERKGNVPSARRAQALLDELVLA